MDPHVGAVGEGQEFLGELDGLHNICLLGQHVSPSSLINVFTGDDVEVSGSLLGCVNKVALFAKRVVFVVLVAISGNLQFNSCGRAQFLAEDDHLGVGHAHLVDEQGVIAH